MDLWENLMVDLLEQKLEPLMANMLYASLLDYWWALKKVHIVLATVLD